MLSIPKTRKQALKAIPLIILLLGLVLVACQQDRPSAATPGPASSTLVSPNEVPAIQTLEVPINARGASQLGSLEFTLVYEPTQLEVVGVKRGSLAGNALVEFDSGTPGRLWTGIVDANGISGEGPVAVVSFRAVEMPGEASPLVLESVSAYNVSTLLDIPVRSSSGEFNGLGKNVTSPEVAFTQLQ